MNPIAPSSLPLSRRRFLHHGAWLLSALAAGSTSLSAAWKESTALPSLSGFGLEGEIPNLKGKVVYLDFWASWCGPCKSSFPVLRKWQQQYAAAGFTVLGVSVDEKEADMTAFLKKTPVPFPIVRDARHQLVAAADVSAMPSSFLVDRKGVIRLVHTGFREKDAALLSARISALLAQTP